MILNNKIWNVCYSIAIVLVVLGHSNGVPTNNIGYYTGIYPWFAFFQEIISVIYIFHIPLFFFISGYFFTFNQNFKQFALSKVKRLLIPYFSITSIALPIKILLSSFSDRTSSFDYVSILSSYIVPWDNPVVFMWFIPTLFLIQVVSYWTSKIELSYLIICIPILVFMNVNFDHVNFEGFFSFLNIGGVAHNIIYFHIGIVLSRIGYFKLSNDKLDFRMKILLLICFSFILMSSEIFYAILGIIFVLFLSIIISKIKYSDLLNDIYIYGFQIYLLSWFFQMFVRVVGYQIFGINVLLSCFLMFTLGLLGPIVIIKMVKLLPFNIGYAFNYLLSVKAKPAS